MSKNKSFTYTFTLARKISLTFIALIIALSIVAIFVRSSITGKLEDFTLVTQQIESGQSKPEQALLLLQQAEDDFQQSLINPDSAKSSQYEIKTTMAINQIDTLLNSADQRMDVALAKNQNIKAFYSKKMKLSSKLVTLKHSFDSLLTVYSQFNLEAKVVTEPKIRTVAQKTNKKIKSNVDTLKTIDPPKKKGLFGRLKDAISNKNTPVKEVIVIERDKQTNVNDLATQRIINDRHNQYANQIKQLKLRNASLQALQGQLILLNSRINKELTQIILELKDINYRVADELKTMALTNYHETSTLLNKLYLAALIMVILFASLLMLFVIKLNRFELLLKGENQRSINIAQQKTDLLLHMSHEIRNPLTAIKGFLHIFARTPLNDRQKEMLSSITSSSDMLLITLNDTLDAAKMETNTIKINKDPFLPHKTINQLIEGMSYSASKKKLYLNYDFEGNKQLMVNGDSFRLQQIIVNLLSNAIKYTAEGGIMVTAKLNDTGLYVDIKDTGMGISQDQQANLFSKYYQTNSSRGQVGTGLGLYICKQMVEVQQGKITVNSEVNKGTTFSFFIPYQTTKSQISNTPDDIISRLDGLHILAVDDNEINLMLLNSMMSKWNVQFYQAPDAETGLDIIENQPIDILLTDIQLPGMSGIELLDKLKGSNGPKNKIPVIALSGYTDLNSLQSFEDHGFIGSVTKPFTEKELLTELAKAVS